MVVPQRDKCMCVVCVCVRARQGRIFHHPVITKSGPRRPVAVWTSLSCGSLRFPSGMGFASPSAKCEDPALAIASENDRVMGRPLWSVCLPASC